MKKLIDFFEDEKNIQLGEVSFQRIESFDIDAETEIQDSFEVNEEDNKIYITVSRDISFNPECIFNVHVSYQVIYKIIEDMTDEFHESDIDLLAEVSSDVETYIPDEMDRVSLIISQLSDAFESRPLVTPPFYSFGKPYSEDGVDDKSPV